MSSAIEVYHTTAATEVKPGRWTWETSRATWMWKEGSGDLFRRFDDGLQFVARLQFLENAIAFTWGFEAGRIYHANLVATVIPTELLPKPPKPTA